MRSEDSCLTTCAPEKHEGLHYSTLPKLRLPSHNINAAGGSGEAEPNLVYGVAGGSPMLLTWFWISCQLLPRFTHTCVLR